MICLFLIGVGCGIAHHAFNSYLDGKNTKSFDQAWALRIGTALSMGFKTAVLASMGMAFAQRVWRTVRQNAMTVKALDSLFGAFSGDPRSLFQRDLYRSARIALLLAISGWLLPIATVFTPATLRVKPTNRPFSEQCIVSNVDLNNITDGGLLRFPSANNLYSGPAPSIQRLAFQSLLSGFPTRSAYLSVPSIGISTSYTLSFEAPALECKQENNTAPPNPNATQHTYWQGVLAQIRDTATSQEIPILQIQYSSNPESGAPANATSCYPFIAQYGVMVTHNATDQTVALLNLTMTSPAGRPPGGAAMQLTGDSALRTGAAALIDATFGTLLGNLTRDQTTGNILPSDSKVGLAWFARSSNQSMFDFSQVPQSVEQLMRNVVMSVMGLGISQAETTCVILDRANIYDYDQSVLISAYLAAVAVALTALGVGLYALKKNGHPGDTSFSGVVLSTRNPTLDHASEGGRQRLLALRVRFGALRATGRPAFGTATDFL